MALKIWLLLNQDMIQSDNGPEFISREFKIFLIKLNIHQKFGVSYNPKSQCTVENFNERIQRFFGICKAKQKTKNVIWRIL